MEEKVTIYSEDELITKKVKKEGNNSFVYSIINIMLNNIGETDKDWKWAKEHDKEDLMFIDLFYQTKDQYIALRKLLTKIVMRQYSCPKTKAENDVSWFSIMNGFPVYENSEEWKSAIREKIKQYEDKNGKLHYEDGYETILKERCDYNI